ncbi:MAG: DUF2666 family protein [Candidatus Diapherotrites archaeon]|nr:DUF2666 family protein [Candidatus Diapherotrites archaeon]
MENEGIQFVAKMGNWVAVRKLTVEEKTDPIMVMEFLAGLSVSFDGKMEEFLGKAVETAKLNAAIDEATASLGKGEKGISEAIAQVNSIAVNKTINEICEKPELQKKEIEELKEFCKILAMRKALMKAGLRIDFSTIETRAIKAAVKKAKKLNK